jgi:hypothetical protein
MVFMTAQAAPRHQVSVATAQMRAAANTVVSASVWSMDPTEAAATLVELTLLKAQVAELEARVAAHADEVGVGDDVGATSTANWLAHTTKQTRAGAHWTIRFGHHLDAHPQVRAALAAGDLLADQAAVIIRAVKALPDDLDPAQMTKAEAHLVAAAAEHDAKALRILGRRLLEVIDPALADAHEAAQLEKEERDAAQACRLTLSDDGHGKAHGRFTVSSLHGEMLKKYVLALGAPKHQAAVEGAGVPRRPSPERMGRAFCELIEAVTAKDLPQAGGTDATIVVTIDYDSLVGRVQKAGVLDTGERISAAAVRRLACTAGIIPAVLNGKGEVLDLGRRQRFFNKPQRIALGIRDGGCTAEGCDCPPALCHAHHDDPWSQGGRSDLAKARLLCPKHHAMAHDPTYELTHHPNGKISFHRRP